MAVQNGGPSSPRPHEQTPLLIDERRSIERDDGSSDTLTDSRRRDEELAEDEDKANQHVGRVRGLLIMLTLCGLMFLQASNLSLVTTTQSKIAEDLDAFALASWFTSAYMIAMSSTTILAGRLAQIFSPRACVLVSSIFFGVGGVVASQGTTMQVFLLGRIIQGIGGGSIMTVSLILVLELSAKKRRGLHIGLVNSVFTMGVSFGAVIAGALLPITGWRFLMWIQGPLSLISGVGVFFSIPKTFTGGDEGEGSISAKLARIDYLGAFTLVTSVVLFLFGLSSPKIEYIPITVSLFLLVGFIIIEFYVSRTPIIPVTVLKNPGVLLSCVAQLGQMASRWTVLMYAPAYALSVRGWNPAQAGSILIPTNLGFALGGLIVGGFHVKRGGSFWLPSVVAYGLFSCTFAVLSEISNEHTAAPLYLLAVLANGLCIGASLNYSLAHILHLTPPSTHFMAASLLTTFRAFAGSFGSAIGGGLFVRVLKARLETGFAENGGLEGREELVRKLLGSPALVQVLTGMEKKIAVESYVGSLNQLFAAAGGLALVMVFVQAGTGWKAGKDEVDETGNDTDEEGRIGVEDEEWEEGMEQGV
ncbi:MFS general substrate transporter [Hyaloscypha variabilis F]|uniref:MFS general substrate transporter n=1 Tax=Hyaloscypha variabilis (strain UAMH 11265 / GT02V1 / F) TaxID=1149755 RepID=A0A2J6S0V3_HYAVF|nr:MFS general substrate transporter [Hyaloscypha variabilis F]